MAYAPLSTTTDIYLYLDENSVEVICIISTWCSSYIGGTLLVKLSKLQLTVLLFIRVQF